MATVVNTFSVSVDPHCICCCDTRYNQRFNGCCLSKTMYLSGTWTANGATYTWSGAAGNLRIGHQVAKNYDYVAWGLDINPYGPLGCYHLISTVWCRVIAGNIVWCGSMTLMNIATSACYPTYPDGGEAGDINTADFLDNWVAGSDACNPPSTIAVGGGINTPRDSGSGVFTVSFNPLP